MKIDVDVYKGPLANTKYVQMQQLTTMAIGVRPLLYDLRDTLEWPIEEELIAIRSQVDFYNKCENPSFEEYCFKNPQAKKVNAILSLYHDRKTSSDPLQNGYAKQLMIAMRGLKEAAEKYRVRRIDNIVLRKIKGRIGSAGQCKEDSFIKFLKPQKNKYRDIKSMYEIFIGRKLGENHGIHHRKMYHEVNNEKAYSKLSECFEAKNKKDKQVLFLLKSRLKVIISSFIDTYREIESVWLTSLDLLDYTEKSNKIDKELKLKTRFAIAALLAKFTNLKYLYFVNKNAPKDKKRIIDYLTQDSLNQKTVPPDYAAFTKQLESAIITQPIDSIALLRESHDQFKGEAPNMIESLEKEYRPLSVRMFGIARHFSLKKNIVSEQAGFIKELTTAVIEANAVMSSTFKRGRLEDGLMTLIENYVNKSECSTEKEEFDELNSLVGVCDFRILSSALVRFAEKILRLANYHVLLSSSGNNVKLVDVEVRGIHKEMNDGCTDTPDAKNDSAKYIREDGYFFNYCVKHNYQYTKKIKEEISAYTKVLQAVGNSIIIQVDELESMAQYESKQENMAETERWALEKMLNESSHDNYQNLLDSFIADIQQFERQIVSHKLIKDGLKKDKAEVDIDTLANSKKISEKVLAGWPVSSGLSARKVSAVLETSRFLQENLDGKGGFFSEMIKSESAVTSSELYAEIKAKLENRLNSELLNDSEKKKYKDVISYFEFHCISCTSEKKLRKELLLTIKQDVNERHKKFSVEKESLENAVLTAERKLQQGKRLLKPLDLKIEEETKSILELTNKLVRYKVGKEQLMIIRDRIFDWVSLQAAVSGARLHQKILEELGECESAASKKTDKCIAKEILSTERSASLLYEDVEGIPSIESSEGYGLKAKSRDVLDQLIKYLQYSQIKSIKAYGVDNALSKNLQQALTAALEQRSGMAYLRPAGAWLRSSFPSTSLQADSGAETWRNELSDQALRSIPFGIGEKHANPNFDIVNTNSEIDKQFWQTINTVRVTGAGATNYVIAKDDIGNWYIKSYSSDPKEIIKAAKGLALYNIGDSLNQNLFSSGEDKTNLSVHPLSKLVTNYQLLYLDNSNSRYKEVIAFLKSDSGFNNQLESIANCGKEVSDNEVDKHCELAIKSFKTMQKEISQELEKEHSESNKEANKINEASISAINKYRRSANNFILAISKKMEVGEGVEKERDRIDRMREALFIHLSEILSSYKAMSEEYQKSLDMLLQAAQ